MAEYLISAAHTVSARAIPWGHNGSLYVPLRRIANNSVDMLKSIDFGQTWAVVDEANSPTNNANVTMVSYPSGDILYVPRTSSAGAVTVQRFDMSTDLWTTAVTGNATATDGGTSSNTRVTVATPTRMAVWFRSKANTRSMKVSVFDGASWTETVLNTNVAGNLALMMGSWVDSSGFQGAYYTNPNEGLETWMAQTINASGALGTQMDIYTAAPGIADPGPVFLFPTTAGGGSQIIPFVAQDGHPGDWEIYPGATGDQSPFALGTPFVTGTNAEENTHSTTSAFYQDGNWYVYALSSGSANVQKMKGPGEGSMVQTQVFTWVDGVIEPQTFLPLLGGVGYLAVDGSTWYFGWDELPPDFPSSGNNVVAQQFQLRPLG